MIGQHVERTISPLADSLGFVTRRQNKCALLLPCYASDAGTVVLLRTAVRDAYRLLLTKVCRFSSFFVVW